MTDWSDYYSDQWQWQWVDSLARCVALRHHDARVGGSVPGLGSFKETKMFLPHPRVKVSIVGSLRDREVACSASDRQGWNFESCVWRTVSSQSSHHHQEVLLAQFSLYVHKGGLKPDSFHFHFICCSGTSRYLRGEYVAGCVYNGLEWLLLWPMSRLFGSMRSTQASRCQGWWFGPRAGQFQHCYTGQGFKWCILALTAAEIWYIRRPSRKFEKQIFWRQFYASASYLKNESLKIGLLIKTIMMCIYFVNIYLINARHTIFSFVNSSYRTGVNDGLSFSGWLARITRLLWSPTRHQIQNQTQSIIEDIGTWTIHKMDNRKRMIKALQNLLKRKVEMLLVGIGWHVTRKPASSWCHSACVPSQMKFP